MKILNSRIYGFLSVLLFFSSCMGVRHLQDDQYLLRRQKIEGNEEMDKSELELLYQSKANKKIPIIPFAPYVWVYHMGYNRFDSAKIELKMDKINFKHDAKIVKAYGKEKKVRKIEKSRIQKLEKKRRVLREGNLLMRWGEPVSVFDEESIERTQSQFDQYLQNRGFFNGSVEYSVKTKGKRRYVSYKVSEDSPHVIDTVRYFTTDKNIEKIISQNVEERKIIAGERYDQKNLIQERERIEKLLKNNGYFDFSRQYISYDVITDIKPYSLEVNLIINQPAKRASHKQFKIDSVIFQTDADTRLLKQQRSHFNYNGITYQYFQKRFSKKVLDQRVFLYPNQLYSLDNTLNTQKQLAYLNNFKFININYDTTGGQFIANIFTSPLQKYQMTNEVGLNVTQGFPGPFYNLSLTNRNVFGGLENLELSGFFGFEGVASATTTDIYSSIESGAKLALIFPQFIIPASSEFKRKVGINNPNTVVRAGFNYTQRPEYDRTNLTGAFDYNWQQERRKLYNLTLLEISLIDSNTDQAFDSVLQRLDSLGNPLIKSFEPSFVSAMNFQVIYNFNPDDFYGNKASILKLFAEAGGTIFNLVDPKVFQENRTDTIQHFQYLKFIADFRRHITINERME